MRTDFVAVRTRFKTVERCEDGCEGHETDYGVVEVLLSPDRSEVRSWLVPFAPSVIIGLS
jgi:hypothetical protein